MILTRFLSSGPLFWITNTSVIAAGALVTSGLMDQSSETNTANKVPAKHGMPAAVAAVPLTARATPSARPDFKQSVSTPVTASNSWKSAESVQPTYIPKPKRKKFVPDSVFSVADEMEDSFYIQQISGGRSSAKTAQLSPNQNPKSNSPAGNSGNSGGSGLASNGPSNGSNFDDADGDGYRDSRDTDPFDPILWRDWDRDGENDPTIELPSIPSVTTSSGSIRTSSSSSSGTVATWVSFSEDNSLILTRSSTTAHPEISD